MNDARRNTLATRARAQDMTRVNLYEWLSGLRVCLKHATDSVVFPIHIGIVRCELARRKARADRRQVKGGWLV